MNFVSFQDLNECIYKNLHKIPKETDLIVGIPRSGSMVANMIALYLNLPYTDVDHFLRKDPLRSGSTRKCDAWIKNIGDARCVLIVDDSITTGKAIKEVKDKIPMQTGVSFKYLAVYALKINCHKVDIFFKICEQPRMFEWNYLHHWALQYACMDIDGVLCEDPGWWQNDDGKKYEDFLHYAKPKMKPTKRIGKLVTCRLEKYRKATEAWLKSNHIEYDELIMLDVTSGKERLLSDQSKFKAEIYKNSGCVLFIESSYEQAVEICRLSNRQVFCVDRGMNINSDNLPGHLRMIKNDFRIVMKHGIKKVLERI